MTFQQDKKIPSEDYQAQQKDIDQQNIQVRRNSNNDQESLKKRKQASEGSNTRRSDIKRPSSLGYDPLESERRRSDRQSENGSECGSPASPGSPGSRLSNIVYDRK